MRLPNPMLLASIRRRRPKPVGVVVFWQETIARTELHRERIVSLAKSHVEVVRIHRSHIVRKVGDDSVEEQYYGRF